METDELVKLFGSAATPTDLYNLACTTRVQQHFRDMDRDTQEQIEDAYYTAMTEIKGRYKIIELDGIPLSVSKVTDHTNEENGTHYITMEGTRKDMGDPFVCRTRAPAIMRYFKQRTALPADVVFIRVQDTRRRSAYGQESRPFWMVHELIPLHLRSPFNGGNNNGE